MRSPVRMVGSLLGLALALPGCGRPQDVQDRLDQAALRSRFGLPRTAEVVAYDGYPSMVGFGQREGLGLSATFQLEPEPAQAFLERAAEAGWEALPIEAGLVERIPFRELEVPLNVRQGAYLCLTAGDEVLHAKQTRSCDGVAQFHDIIFGVFDSTTNQVWVTVRSGY